MVFAPLVVCCRAGTLDLLLLLEGRVSEICAYYDLLCCICLFFYSKFVIIANVA